MRTVNMVSLRVSLSETKSMALEILPGLMVVSTLDFGVIISSMVMPYSKVQEGE